MPAPITSLAATVSPLAKTAEGRPAVSAVHTTLRRVWAEVFDAAVGDHDDFFELGGNSLLALRMFAGLRAAGLTPIALRDLYLNPRIADLAPMMESGATR